MLFGLDALAVHITLSACCRSCLSAPISLSSEVAHASVILMQAYCSEGQKYSEDPPGPEGPVLDLNGPSKQSGLHACDQNGNAKRSTQHTAEANGSFSIQMHVHHKDNTVTLWP